MLRSSLIAGCRNVLDALNRSGVTELFGRQERFDPEETKLLNDKLIVAVMEYKVLASRFGKPEESITHIMEIKSLHDANWLPIVVKELVQQGPQQYPQEYFKMANKVEFLVTNVPRFMDVLAQEDLPNNFYEKDLKKRLEEKYSGIEIILIEEEGKSSSIDRVTLALSSIQQLYDVCAEVEKLPKEGLSVVACDSGSDKTFGLTGLSKAVELLREVIISIWERAVYFREIEGSHRIKNIAEVLPILDRIPQMHNNKNLGDEEAEILRRKAIEAATNFLEAGVITADISERTSFNPRQILAPEPKLLTHINQDDTSPTDNVHQPKIGGSITAKTEEFIEKLNPEQRRALRDKLKDEDNDSEN